MIDDENKADIKRDMDYLNDDFTKLEKAKDDEQNR